MAPGVNNAKRLILLLLKNYNRPMERRMVHSLLHSVAQKLKTDLGFQGRYPYSPLIDRELTEMIGEGLLKRLYIVGPRYTELYREYVSLSEKGRELASQLNDPDLERMIREHLLQLSSKQGDEAGVEG